MISEKEPQGSVQAGRDTRENCKVNGQGYCLVSRGQRDGHKTSKKDAKDISGHETITGQYKQRKQVGAKCACE